MSQIKIFSRANALACVSLAVADSRILRSPRNPGAGLLPRPFGEARHALQGMSQIKIFSRANALACVSLAVADSRILRSPRNPGAGLLPRPLGEARHALQGMSQALRLTPGVEALLSGRVARLCAPDRNRRTGQCPPNRPRPARPLSNPAARAMIRTC